MPCVEKFGGHGFGANSKMAPSEGAGSPKDCKRDDPGQQCGGSPSSW